MSLFFYLDLQIQELGLQRPYQTDNGTYTYLRKVMALPFLPHGEIEPMFVQLHAQATTATLQRFMEYISETWTGAYWFGKTWGVHQILNESSPDHDLHFRPPAGPTRWPHPPAPPQTPVYKINTENGGFKRDTWLGADVRGIFF